MNINDIEAVQMKYGHVTRLGLHRAVMAEYPNVDETTIDELVYEYCKRENEASYPEEVMKMK